MNSLEKVKHDGAVSGLQDHMRAMLWRAKTAIDNAMKENFESLPSDVGNARTCLDAALEAWRERDSMQKKSPSGGG